MRVQLGILSLIVLAAFETQAQSDCSILVKELQAMKRAQSSVLQSFVNKNDSMSRALEMQADHLEKNEDINESTQSLRQSAKAFRRHKEREQQLISRFDSASAALVDQIEKCLDQTSVKKLGQR